MTARPLAKRIRAHLAVLNTGMDQYPVIRDLTIPLLRESRDEIKRLRGNHQRVIDVVNSQVEDDGLWFEAKTAPEAYLQQELRRLHAFCETPAALHTEGGASLADLRGVAPDATGSEMSEDFIRRKRDEGERLRLLLIEIAKWSDDDCGRCMDNVDRIVNFQRAALHTEDARAEGGGDA